MKTSFRFALVWLTLSLATRAWGHGFSLFFPVGYDPSTPPPTSFNIFSESSVLDQDGLTAGPGNLFLDAFDKTQAGDGSYGTFEGFAEVTGTQPTIVSATFRVLSPLYFADGTNPVAPASQGTYLHISFADDTDSGINWPSYFASNPGLDINGTTSLLNGFTVAPTTFPLPPDTADPAYHELAKDLHLEAGSDQTYGEFGFAFDMAVTFQTGSGPTATMTTVSTGPLVDVFATDIGTADHPDGGFATYADDSLQDAATLAIYSAAVPEPSTLGIAAIGVAILGCGGLRKLRGAHRVDSEANRGESRI